MPQMKMAPSGAIQILERETRFEPATFSLATRSSTTELLPQSGEFIPDLEARCVLCFVLCVGRARSPLLNKG